MILVQMLTACWATPEAQIFRRLQNSLKMAKKNRQVSLEYEFNLAEAAPGDTEGDAACLALMPDGTRQMT